MTLEEKDKEVAIILGRDIGAYEQRLLRNRLTALRSRYGDGCIGKEWSEPNGVGSRRFVVWLWQQYKALPKNANPAKYCLVLRRKKGKYTPGNCKLGLKKNHLPYKVQLRIPDDVREGMIKMATDKPNIKLREIAAKYPYSLAAISITLRKHFGCAIKQRRQGAVA